MLYPSVHHADVPPKTVYLGFFVYIMQLKHTADLEINVTPEESNPLMRLLEGRRMSVGPQQIWVVLNVFSLIHSQQSSYC